jgi:hypothetical protein
LIREKLADAFQGLAKILGTTNSAEKTDPLRSHYDSLEAAYLNSNLYDRLATLARRGTEEHEKISALRSLRNPAHRVVEFYSAKLRLDTETIEYGEDATARADALGAAIKLVNRWSNWGAEERVASRQFAWAGDLFVKVSHKEKNDVPVSVYLERIDPRHVPDFDKDERGFFTYLRIDTPKTRRLESGKTEDYTQTEVWSKDESLYSVYEHDKASNTPVDELGAPVEETVLSGEAVPDEEGGYTGYDFIPVVHAKCRDIGAERGLSVFGHAFSNIREADRIATKLHDMLFPDIVWLLTRSHGPSGEPLPPIELEQSPDSPDRVFSRMTAGREAREGYVTIGGEKVIRPPSGAAFEPKIPDRNFQAHANALAEQVKEVERDLPETAYSRLRELELSGRAMRYSLTDIADRYTEVFGNLVPAMVRAYQMAFTIGQVLELEGFSEAEIGSYGTDGEQFDFSFVAPDPFPTSIQDDLETEKTRTEVHAAWMEIGGEPYKRYLLSEGYDEEAADALVAAVGSAPRSAIDELLNGRA